MSNEAESIVILLALLSFKSYSMVFKYF